MNICWHLNIYEQDKFRDQLSWVGYEKSFMTSRTDLLIHTVWHTDCILEVFLKVYLEISTDDKNLENFPSMQRVISPAQNDVNVQYGSI